MAGRRRWWTWVVAAGLSLSMGGCGDGGGSDCGPGQTGPSCPTPSPPIQTCTQNTLYTNSGAVPSLVLIYSDFSVPEGGRLDMTLDWTNTSSQMGMYLVPANTCTVDEFNKKTCNFLVRSDPPGPKPRKVSTANFTAGNYRFLIANYSDEDESAALQIVLSKGNGCPALTGTAPSASAREDASPLVVERAEHR